MRQLVQFDEEGQAYELGDVLLAAGIANSVKPSRDGSACVWVHDEGRLHEAEAIAKDFEAAPDAPRFTDAATAAAATRKSSARDAERAAKRVVKVRDQFAAARRVGPVTIGLILASVAVAFLTTTPDGIARMELGDRLETVRMLSFQSYVREGGYYRWPVGLPDLRAGEVWRIVTPIFIHFGLFHIVFNMWWLRDLGTMVERRQSSLLLAAMVFVVAGISNAAQFIIGGSPSFGGMSGVVYGLFAYIWIRGRFDPRSGYGVQKQTLYWMLGFFVICWTGLLGPIANVAHSAGLVVGAAWGWLAAGGLKRLRPPR